LRLGTIGEALGTRLGRRHLDRLGLRRLNFCGVADRPGEGLLRPHQRVGAIRPPSTACDIAKERGLEDFAEEKTRFVQMQSATLNILDDADAEKQRLKTVQPSMLNILEDFAEERPRYARVQTATLNILEDFSEEKTRSAQLQTAT
jgi:hypothetical protein